MEERRFSSGRLWRRVAEAGLLALLAFSGAGHASDVINQAGSYPALIQAKNATSFVVGGLFSVTSDGNSVLSKGILRAEAFKCAIKVLNDANFIPGVTLNYNLQDDIGAASTGLYKSLVFIQGGVMAVVGAGPSSVSDPVARLLSTFNTPIISYASTAASLSDRTKYPTLFRTVANDNTQTKAMVAVARKFQWTLMGAAGTSDTYGSAGLQGFVDEATSAGIVVTCNRIISHSTSLSEVTAFGQCLQDAKVNVVMLFMNEIDSSTIITNLKIANLWSSEMVFIASDSWATSDVITYGTKNFADFSPSLIKGTIGVIQQPGDLSWFSPCYGQMTPANNNYTLFLNYWQSRFVCKLSGAGLPTCNSTISTRSASNPCLCTGSESLANDSANNKNAFVYDAVLAIANAIKTILTNCTALTFKDLCTPTSFSSDDLLKTIQFLNFTGKTGRVGFNGVDPRSASYYYLQYNGSSWVNIGQYDSTLDTADVQDTSMVWNTAGGAAPFSQIVPKVMGQGHPVVIIVDIISGLNIIFGLVCIVLFQIHKEKPVVKRSSPIFCALILVGLVLVWASLYMWAGNQTVGLCSAKIWVGAIGFSLVMGNLLAKNYRIWRIFDNDKLRSRVITNQELLYFSGVIVGIEVILVGVLMYDPPVPLIVKSSSSILYQYQACASGSKSFQTIMTWVIFGYNVLLVLVGAVLAYLTRKVISSFNESKFIAVSMYNILVCMVVIAPIYFTSGDGEGIEERLYIVRSMAVLFASTITMLALFAPKVRTLLKDANKEDHATNRTSEGGTANNSSRFVTTRPQTTTMRPFTGAKDGNAAAAKDGDKKVKQPATLEATAKIAKTAEVNAATSPTKESDK